MKVFTADELESIQRSINDDFSFFGEINPEEERWRSWYTEARSITAFRTKKNKPFWDLRCPDFGVEWKKHKCAFQRPEDVLGKRVGHVGSRVVNLNTSPSRDAQENMRTIAEGYNALVGEFIESCGGEAYHGVVVHNDDAIVYYETRVQAIDTARLTAEWVTRGDKTNLQVLDEDGQKVFTFLPNGNKISVVIPVPDDLSEVHYFKAEKDVIWEPISADFYEIFMADYPGMTFKDAILASR